MTMPGQHRRIVTNTAAQVIGRNGIALARLVLAGMVVRTMGAGTFAEYSLLFGLLTVAEWIVDFGTSEVFVRDLSRDQNAEQKLARLRLLFVGRLFQVPVAFIALALALFALGYPRHVVLAGLIGGTSLALFGAILVYRVLFRANLSMERELTAEVISVVAMIPMIAVVARSGGGLVGLMACHVLSRVVYLGASAWFGRRQFQPSLAGVRVQESLGSLRSASVIGVTGLLAGVYELADLLLLSKLASLTDVAHYSAAQRLAWPLLMALTAIGGTLYPIASARWPDDRIAFGAACQRGVDTVAVFAGLAFSAVLAGPEFFLGLLGEPLVAAAPVLRVIAVLCLFKAVTSTVGPLLYVVNAQAHALRFVAVALVLKIAVLLPVAATYGALGVAWGALAIEVLWGVTVSVYLFQRFSGYRLRWGSAVRAGLAVAIAVAAVRLAVPSGGLPAAVAAPVLYASLATLIGAVRLTDVRWLLKRRIA